MFNSKLPISYYKDIAVLNAEHRIYAVQHVETAKIYLKKIIRIYNMAVYEQLYKSPVRGIPRIYAMYESGGELTVIEEYVSGDTLQEILDIHGPVNEASAISYAIALCDILTRLCAMTPPIVHRDIKPSNIILTEDERIVLIDLNAARQDVGSKSRDTVLIGTEGFAAPEQFGFAPSTAQTDIYAVGRLLCELLGFHPEAGPLKTVIDRCLEMEPGRRYLTAEALKKALQGCLKYCS